MSLIKRWQAILDFCAKFKSWQAEACPTGIAN
jgi:hypothetical protein